MVKDKDWVGDKTSVYKTLGASSHCEDDREINDYYATEPKAVEMLMSLEQFDKHILEPACGEGHISKVLGEHGYKVLSSDIIDRNYGLRLDFFTYEKWKGDIITNPPYKYAREFVEHALKIITKGNKIAFFLKLTFLEGKARKRFFSECPPKIIYVSSSRLVCAKNGIFDRGSAVAYAWFIWEKGFKGDPRIKWFN